MNKKRPKLELVVVKAINHLQNIHGPTSREISDYISHELEIPISDIKGNISLALRRAVNYGILKQINGKYIYNYDLLNNKPGDGDQIVEAARKKRSKGGKQKKKSGSRKKGSAKSKKASKGSPSKKRRSTRGKQSQLKTNANKDYEVLVRNYMQKKNESQSESSSIGNANESQDLDN